MDSLQVKEDYKYRDYYIQEKIGDQTYKMVFQSEESSKKDIVIFAIYICVYSKRKHEESYDQKITSTGKSPWTTFTFMKQAFQTLEQYVIDHELPQYKKMIIMCHWLDNRRRDAYYHYLKRFGYEYKYYWGKKCIAKEFINE